MTTLLLTSTLATFSSLYSPEQFLSGCSIFPSVMGLLGAGGAQQEAPYSPLLHTATSQQARSPDELEMADEQQGQYNEELYSNINTIPGVPGSDYPTLATIPSTSFSCAEKLPGFYADEEAGCQVSYADEEAGCQVSYADEEAGCQVSYADEEAGCQVSYADEEAGCQVWHYCKTDGIKESFLCPNGTIYNQVNRVCEWWFNVLCENTKAAFRVNEDLYIIPPSTAEPTIPQQYQPQQEPQPEHQQQSQQEPQQHPDYYAS
ncbi:Chitin binding domain [Trinorchestia longiramus]|nr:Chitin binding domain [Trinorchestia longiramus]